MNRMLKSVAYMKAPKLSFAAFNPRKAALLKAGQMALGRLRPRRREPAYGKMALKGLGAAAMAIPLGLWLGRRVTRRAGESAAATARS